MFIRRACAWLWIVPTLACAQKLPDLSFTTSMNESVRTRDFKGAPLFVDIWALTCRPCEDMRAAAFRLSDRFAGRGVRFLGVSEDGVREVWRNFLIQHPSPQYEVWDERHSFRRAMHVARMPAVFIFDSGLQVRWRASQWTKSSEADAAACLERLLRESPP